MIELLHQRAPISNDVLHRPPYAINKNAVTVQVFNIGKPLLCIIVFGDDRGVMTI